MDLCLANVTKQKQKNKKHKHIECKKYELIEWAREERMYLYNIAPMHVCRLIVNLNYMLYGHNHHQSALYKHTHTKKHIQLKKKDTDKRIHREQSEMLENSMETTKK